MFVTCRMKTRQINIHSKHGMSVSVLAYMQYCDEPWRCHLLLHVAVFLWGVNRERGLRDRRIEVF